MTYVVTFNDAQPSAREDQIWTQVRIDEAATASGSWTVLETQTLSPADTNPMAPRTRDITTTLATLAAGWYRLAFLDADGNQDLTAPVSRSGLDGPYFTLAEIRASFPELTSVEDDVLEGWRDEVEERLEHFCDVAFVPRSATAIVGGTGGRYLAGLPNNRLRTLTSVSDSGTTVDVSGAVLQANAFYSTSRWSRGDANLIVTYTHGYSSVPRAIKEAAMVWTRQLATRGPLTDRATGMSTESGAVISFATTVPSGIPDVDQVAAEYSHRPAAG